MTINAGAVMRFDRYAIEDSGIRMWFVCNDPGPGQSTDWPIFLTDADLAAVSTQGQLLTLVTTKLQRALRAVGIGTKLDPFIGQTITLT